MAEASLLTMNPVPRGAAAIDAMIARLRLPVIGAPMFIVSGPELVIAQCKAGIVGSLPALNARPQELLDSWLRRIRDELAAHDVSHPDRPAAPFAVNLTVHRSNLRLEADLETCIAHKVPIVITSLGARADVVAAVQAYGGMVIHDVIHNTFARKAVDKGVNGLVAVAAGAGGHAGRQSPFALLQEIRAWWSGPLVLSGAISTGSSILAALAAGADAAYVGSPFIATFEANAHPSYKQMIVEGGAEDIVYTSAITGVAGNYLRRSLEAAGLDPEALPIAPGSKLDYSSGTARPRAWRDVWGAGQGIGAVRAETSVADLVGRWASEWKAAVARTCARARQFEG